MFHTSFSAVVFASAMLAQAGEPTPPTAVSISTPGSSLSAGATPAKSYGIATDHQLATDAAAEMLERGGNAVDAAVAASFVLSVCRPFACGIGGGGFMVISLPGKDGRVERALNYREMCPAGINSDSFIKPGLRPHSSEFGGLAVATPGTVGGLLYALEKYGTLPRAVVMAPAINAAMKGFVVDAAYEDAVARTAKKFKDKKEYKDRFLFVWEQLFQRGAAKVGVRITNTDQAAALRLIAAEGADVFYKGLIAQAIVGSVAADGGVLTLADLSRQVVSETAPLRGAGFGRELLTMPPPSSGGVALLQMVGMVERQHIKVGSLKSSDPGYLFILIESMKFAFADRAYFMADPAFVDVPTDQLLSDAHLEMRVKVMSKRRTMNPDFYAFDENGQQLVEDGGTSHISIVDAHGGAVACTETINLTFGSLLEAKGFGFVLNNQMDDFTTSSGPNAFGLTQSKRNAPHAGKRPLSSMTPTIVLRNSAVEMVAGGAGGPRIITATTQVLLNHLLFGMSAADAVLAPRVHHQWKPSELVVEERLTEEYNGLPVFIWLVKFGHRLEKVQASAGVNLVLVGNDSIEAAADARRGGSATPRSHLLPKPNPREDSK